MFCPSCGATIADGSTFCPSCGNQIQNSAPVAQQPVYQQPAVQQPVYQQPVYQQPAYQQQPNYGVVNGPENIVNSIKTLGIVAIIFGLLSPLVGWICGGIGLGKANNLANTGYASPTLDNAKTLCIVGLVIATVIFLISFVILMA